MGTSNAGNLTDGLDGQPWGVRVSGLSRDDAQGYQDSGSDALVFGIEGTSASALVTDELARFLCVDPNMDDKELRAVSSLPIDGFVMPLTQGNDGLTLGDLASVGSVSRRSDKYIVLEVEKPIEAKDLEALRDIGVHALLVDVDVIGIDNLNMKLFNFGASLSKTEFGPPDNIIPEGLSVSINFIDIL